MSRARVGGSDLAAAERQDAARLMLAHPLVTAERPDPEAFRLIRRHRDELAQDFRQLFGYRLVVEAHFARLYKAGLGPGRGRPLRRASGAPFSPAAYTYLALTCAVLLTSRQQVLLSALVEDIRSAAAEAEVELGDSMTDRRALVAALRQLIARGVLEEDDGSVERYAADASSEALLFVQRDLVRHLLAIPLREVDTPEELIQLAAEPPMVGGARHAVRRLVVEEPAVLADDLDPEQWAWLRQYQRREARVLAEALGLELEVRAEGVMAVDPQDELTDLRFPAEGTVAQAALLTVSELVDRLAPPAAATTTARDDLVASIPVPDGMVEVVVAELADRHGRRWKKDYAGRPDVLAADVVDLLVAAGLLARRGRGLQLRAVAARYAPEAVVDDHAGLAADASELPIGRPSDGSSEPARPSHDTDESKGSLL